VGSLLDVVVGAAALVKTLLNIRVRSEGCPKTEPADTAEVSILQREDERALRTSAMTRSSRSI
jgi:hypothetical protein